jgi:hypothetical protein
MNCYLLGWLRRLSLFLFLVVACGSAGSVETFNIFFILSGNLFKNISSKYMLLFSASLENNFFPVASGQLLLYLLNNLSLIVRLITM